MVRGIDNFKKYFEEFTGNYVIIGGTACDIIIDDAGLTPRATRDIDLILIVEALSAEFVKQFWKFIEAGQYERKEKSEDDRKHYRFIKPASSEFPFQVELFSRNPNLLDLDEDSNFTPIPVDDDLSSLSAILMNEDYYNYLIEHSTESKGLHIANTEALICLKARAYLDISKRIADGSREDSKHVKKHKGDVFRLGVMLTEDDEFDLPEPLKQDLQEFADTIADDLPDKAILKSLGVGAIPPQTLLEQMIKSFKLNGK